MKVSTIHSENTVEERKINPDSYIEIEVRSPQTHGKKSQYMKKTNCL